MRNKFFLFVLSLLSLSLPILAQVSNDNVNGVYKVSENTPKYVPNEVIIKFKDDSGINVRHNSKRRFVSSARANIDNLLVSFGTEELQQLMPESGKKATIRKVKSLNGETVEDVDLSQLYVARFDSTKTSVEDAINALQQLDEVEYAEPNYIAYICGVEEGSVGDTDPSTYNDPMRSQQWGIDAINLPKLWSLDNTDSKRPVIAILDTGCDITHPDLADNIWTNEAESSGEELEDDDNNNYFDDIHGYNFVEMNTDLTDNCGHGTHCAGIAAAVGNNGIGIIGANPDAIIMPVKVLQDNGTGDMATIIKGIDYAIANGANVLNMSFGMTNTASALENAIDKAYSKSVIMVAAAGNSGYEYHNSKFPGILYPAAYNNVIGVMATTQSGGRAGFTNTDDGEDPPCKWPEKHYTVYAPGQNIMSTYPGGLYKSLSGTSMAAPLVAGALSRVLQYRGFDYAADYGLLGDTYFAHSTDSEVLDIYSLSQYTEDNRELYLSLTSEIESVDSDNDGTIDAGERVNVYPIINVSRGHLSDKTTLSITPVEPNEINDGDREEKLFQIAEENLMPSKYYDIEVNTVNFGWSINTSGSQKGKSPFVIKIHDDAPNGKNIRLKTKIIIEDMVVEDSLQFKIDNVAELSGTIAKDTILPGKVLVAKNCAILPGVTVTLSDGTDLSGDIINYGKIVATRGSVIRGIWVSDYWDESQSKNIRGRTTLEYGSKLYTEILPRTLTRVYKDAYDDNGNLCTTVDYGFFDPDSILKINAGAQIYITKPKNFDEVNYVDFKFRFCSKDSLIGTNEAPIYIYGDVQFDLNEKDPEWHHINVIGEAHIIQRPYLVCSDCHYTMAAFYDATTFNATNGFVFENKTYVDDYELDEFLAHTEKTAKTSSGLHYWNLYCYLCGALIDSQPSYYNDGKEVKKSNLYCYKNASFYFKNRNVNTDGGKENVFEHCNVYDEKAFGNIYWNKYIGFRYMDCLDSLVNCNLLGSYNSVKIRKWALSRINYLIYGEPSYLYYDVLETPPTEILVPYYCGSSSLDWINNHAERSVWWPKVKYTGFAEGADKPNPNCPGMVWTIKFDGYDTHDEYDEMPTIGVGKHKVDIWFNTAMDKTVKPTITMGLSYPYTNKTIDEDGVWNEDGTIYTAYLTLTNKSGIDGINYLLVSDAVDATGLTILPQSYVYVKNFSDYLLNTPFKVNVQVAGALSTDLAAEAGIGKVTLNWNTDDADFVDLMGYNIYRFIDNSTDTVKINTSLIDAKEKEFIDYNVIPETTYHYLVREIATDFQEFDVSNVVSATPVNAEKGDANGSMSVDVADVMTDVYYLIGANPQPFIFDAADVNSDKSINVLDIIGTVNIIKKDATAESLDEQEVAIFSIQDGVLYVETPCALSGVQVQLSGDKKDNYITVAENMNGFENVNEWLSDQTYFFLGYSMSGHVLAPGKHAILNIGTTDITDMVLSDTHGHNVMLIKDDATSINNTGDLGGCTYRFTDLAGRSCNAKDLKSGVYVVSAIKNGVTVKTFKLMKK